MDIVTRLPGEGQDLSHAIRTLLTGCAMAWARELAQRPIAPLYSSGVRYRPEPWAGELPEEWADPHTVLERKWGDCDDLVIYRLAELLAAGERATVVVYRDTNQPKYHVAVRRASGELEDPSLICMKD